MNVGLTVAGEAEMTEGERQEASAVAVLDAVLRLLDAAVAEDEGGRFVDLVDAAHDFGSCLFHQVRGCCEPPSVKPSTMALLVPLLGRMDEAVH